MNPRKIKDLLFHNNIINILFFISFLLFFVIILFKNKHYLSIISIRKYSYFSIMLVFSFFNVCLRGIVNLITFNFNKQKLTFFEGYKLATIHTMGNYLPFSGGIIAKGILLKKQFDIGYKYYAVISVYTFIIAVVISGLYGLFTIIMLHIDNYILFLSFILMLSSIVFLFLPFPNIKMFSKYYFIAQLQEPRLYFKSVVIKIIAIYTVFFLVAGIKMYYSFQIINIRISFLESIFLISGAIVTRLVTFTPGSIGVREAIVATFAHVTSINYQLAIIAAGIDRLAEIFVNFGTGGLILIWEKFRRP